MLKMPLRSSPTLWVTAEKIFAQLFWLLVFVVQAPLLGPYAFGSLTIVMVFIGFWDAVPRIAATDALISIRNIDRLHFSTVTTACVLFSLVFGAAVFGFAGPFAAALGDARLAPIMRALAVLPLVQSFSIAPTAATQREEQFQSTTIRTVASLLAGGFVGLVLALAGAGVWALVCQALVQGSVAAIVLWFAVPLPFGLEFSRRHFRDLARFALPAVLARTMSWAEGQIPRLVLGVFLGPAELGLFGLGARLTDVVSQVAIGPEALVARVGLRRFATDPEALAKAVRRVFFRITLLSFPLCLGGAAVAPTLFHVWLDPRWLEGIVPSQLMLLMGVPSVTYYVAAAVLLALNRQKWEAGISTLQTVSILIVIAASARFGLVTVAAAITARSLVMLPLPILLLHRTCGLRLQDILLPQVPALVAAGLMATSVSLLRERLAATTGVAALFILVAIGAAIYAFLMAAMMPKSVAKIGKYIIDAAERRFIASLRTRKLLRPLGLEWLLYYRRHRRLLRTTERYRRNSSMTEVLSKLGEMNLVFTVTAGRSGTTFAHKLFSLLPEVTSEHEPDPAFHAYLRQVECNADFAREFLLRYKLPFVSSLQTTSYVELSHVFCKGFFEPLLDLGITPNLLLLRRDPRLVALSYFERYTVPERTFFGIEWLLSPRFARRLPLAGWRRMTDYQLLFWYALEIERRQREYSRIVRSRGGVVGDASPAELRDFGCFAAVAQTLGLLSPTADHDALAGRHAAVAGISWNGREGPLWSYEGDIDRDEEEVWQAVSAADPDLRPWVQGRYHGLSSA